VEGQRTEYKEERAERNRGGRPLLTARGVIFYLGPRSLKDDREIKFSSTGGGEGRSLFQSKTKQRLREDRASLFLAGRVGSKVREPKTRNSGGKKA